ncbi:hypothetical protein S83_025489 [Arachis hypogaea]
MPATPSCMTPSPPSKKISPGNTQTEQKYMQCTPIKVHPLLKGQMLDEDDEERLYAFEIAQKRLWVLDSMNTGEPKNERLNIHAYAGRIIKDMAKVSMAAYKHMENGLPRFYPSVPQQHNGCDCGVFVSKFMQFWSLDKPLQHWDKEVVNEFRREIILDIVMGLHNSEIGKALQALDSHHVCRNQPRKKTKAVRSPCTAPSAKSMLQRVGLPTRKPNKGGRQRKKKF